MISADEMRVRRLSSGMTEYDVALLLMVAANGEKLNTIARALSREATDKCAAIDTELRSMLSCAAPSVSEFIGFKK